MRIIHIRAVGNTPEEVPGTPAVTVRASEANPTRQRPPEKRHSASPSTRLPLDTVNATAHAQSTYGLDLLTTVLTLPDRETNGLAKSPRHGRDMTSERDTVFITGVTGLLGARIASRIAQLGARTIGLIHGTTRKPRHSTLGGVAAVPFDGPDRHRTSVIELVAGDITQDKLGLNNDTYSLLVRKATSIVHCAAVTRFHSPRPEHMSTNVRGTFNVGRLAARSANYQLLGLYHLSTLYVAGLTKSKFDEDDLEIGQSFANDYEESKYLAEIAMRCASKNRFPLCVVRPSVVTGDFASGEIAKFQGIYPILRSVASGIVRVLPAGLSLGPHLVPIDYVGDVISAIVSSGSALGRVLHLTAQPNVPIRDFICALRAVPNIHAPRIIDPNSQEARALNSTGAYQGILRHYEPYLTQSKHFCDRQTREYLKETFNIIPPQLDVAYLLRLLMYCRQCGYF